MSSSTETETWTSRAWKSLRPVLKKVRLDREVEMVLEKHLHGGPLCIQACRDAQIYGIYEVPLLLAGHVNGPVVVALMEDLLETDAVRRAKRSHELKALLARPLDDATQARIAAIKEEMEIEAREEAEL